MVDIDPGKVSKFGFAKLLGSRGDEPVEYLIRKYEVVLGRNSKNSTADVVLGESMSISRKHAVIRYNFEANCFELIVMGKNGVKVGDVTVSPEDQPRELYSGDCISTASESSMHFLLPKRSHPYKNTFNGGSGTPALSDASHPLAHAAAATADDTPVPTPSLDAGVQPVPGNPAGIAAVRMSVGMSPLQGGLQGTVRFSTLPHIVIHWQMDGSAILSYAHDLQGLAGESQRMWPIGGAGAEGMGQPDTIMDDSPSIGSEQPLGLQNLSLPLLPGPALQYGGSRGSSSMPHSAARP